MIKIGSKVRVKPTAGTFPFVYKVYKRYPDASINAWYVMGPNTYDGRKTEYAFMENDLILLDGNFICVSPKNKPMKGDV